MSQTAAVARIEALWNAIQRSGDQELCTHDKWRTDRYFYGVEFDSVGPEAVYVDVDGRSGWIALRFCLQRPQGTAFVLLNDEVAKLAIESIAERFGIQNIRVFIQFADMVRSIESDGGVVDLLRVELCSDIRELRFAENWKVGYVCGEFSNDCVNPASIYRRSQRLAKKFYWRPLYGGTIVAGTMDRGPAISVIIPVYNVEKYIDDCVSSVLDQSFDDYEVILVDDGSTDRSGEHCDHLSRVDKRVRVISKSNGGCASARMAGLDAAVGDYVMFVDSDDCLAPQALRRLYEAAIAQNAEIAQGTWSRVFQDGQTTSGNLKERGFIFQIGQSGFGINKDFAILETPTIWRRIYKRVFLKDNGIEFPIQFRRFDDLPFQFHSIALASRIAHTPHDVYNYKVGRDGQDVSINDERLFIHFPLLAYVRSLARRIGTNDAFKTFIRIQLATHTWGLQKIVPELRKKYTLFIARDLFGPEQGHNSFRLLRRLLRVGHGRRVEILKLYLLFLLRARKVRLPQ